MLEKSDIQRLMNEVQSRCTGVSEGGLQIALRSVLSEFFRDSLCWREHIHLLVTVGIQEYKLLTRDGGQPITLLGVVDGQRLGVAAFMPRFGELHVRSRIQTSSVQPVTTNPPTPAPLSPTNPWLVTVAETVKNVNNDGWPIAPHWVLQEYYPDILDGVLGNLMEQPGKSYSNQTNAAYHLKRFRQGIQIARTAAARENAFGAQTWRFPGGWESRNQRNGMVSAFPPPTRF